MLRNFEAHPMLLLVLIVLVVLLFGAKRLPDAARSVGRSMRIFKSEVKEMKDDGKASTSPTSSETEATPSRPLEGRVVDEPRREQTTAPTYDQQRHSA